MAIQGMVISITWCLFIAFCGFFEGLRTVQLAAQNGSRGVIFYKGAED
jgi:hypothetical protein